MLDFFHFAYLDPSTGSLFIQSVIGVMAGVGVFGRRALASGVRKVRSRFVTSKETEVEQQ